MNRKHTSTIGCYTMNLTRSEFRTKWDTNREDWRKRQFIAPIAPILDEVISDAEAVERDEADQLLTLTEAGAISGYSASHLGRLVRQGRLLNFGRQNAPRVRFADLPKKTSEPRLTPESSRHAAQRVVTHFGEQG